VSARARYAQCVEAAGAEKCEVERERMVASERNYQESARRGWACDPKQPDCPTAR
jgi:hypothetical protein